MVESKHYSVAYVFTVAGPGVSLEAHLKFLPSEPRVDAGLGLGPDPYTVSSNWRWKEAYSSFVSSPAMCSFASSVASLEVITTESRT